MITLTTTGLQICPRGALGKVIQQRRSIVIPDLPLDIEKLKIG
jgi:hypothetical protein